MYIFKYIHATPIGCLGIDSDAGSKRSDLNMKFVALAAVATFLPYAALAGDISATPADPVVAAPEGGAVTKFALPNFNLQDISVGAGISTLGFYVAPEYKLNEKLSVRTPFYFGSYKTTVEDAGNDFQAKLDTKSLAIMADYRPFANGLRVSGGLSYGGYDLDMSTVNPTLKGVQLDGRYDFEVKQKNDIVPMVSVGYSAEPLKNLSITAEFGAKFTKYEVNTNLDRIDNAQWRQLVSDERQRLNEDLADMDVTPFISLGVTYRF